MVRLLGKIKEAAILPTHDTILKHTVYRLAVGGTAAMPVEYNWNTGFQSVKHGWGMITKSSFGGATFGLELGATVGATLGFLVWIAGATGVTLDLFAIGDLA